MQVTSRSAWRLALQTRGPVADAEGTQLAESEHGCNHSAREEGRGGVEVPGGVEMGEVTKAWLGGSGETLPKSLTKSDAL